MQNAPCLRRIHEEKDICTTCNKPFKWSKRNWVKGDMIEVEFITAHAGCRSKMRALREQKEKLEEEIVNIEWEMYKLCNQQPFERLSQTNFSYINGTYYLK